MDFLEKGKHKYLIRIYEVVEAFGDIFLNNIYQYKTEHKNIIVSLVELKNTIYDKRDYLNNEESNEDSNEDSNVDSNEVSNEVINEVNNEVSNEVSNEESHKGNNNKNIFIISASIDSTIRFMKINSRIKNGK